MSKICLLFGIALACLGQIESTLNPRVVCYYESWYYWRTSYAEGKMTTADVDASLCTDIVYGYLGATKTAEVYISDPWLMDNLGDLKNFTKNKGSAKALVAIGGFNLTPNLTYTSESESSRNTFANSVVDFCRKFGFDGISLDWSETAWLDEEFDKYKALLNTLHSKFASERFTLGITVPARGGNFRVGQVNDLVDFITVQTYDLHGNWEKKVGYEAPVDWQVQMLQGWFDIGAPIEKLLMSIPFFGHTWLLADASKSEPGSEATGAGPEGPYTKSAGKLGYAEMCQMIIKGGWQLKADSELLSNYAVKDKFWVSFEDAITVAGRAKNATTMGFGGVVIQTLTNDDYQGNCGEKYALLKAVNKALNKDPIDVPTHAPGSTVEYTITPDPSKFCKKEGVFRDTKDCNIYHKCIEFFPDDFTDEIFHCPQDQGFDEKSQKCVDKSLVPECH